MSEEQTTRTGGPLAEVLRSIHERMRDVSEEEVLAALSETETRGALTATTFTRTISASAERQARTTESASTRTAS